MTFTETTYKEPVNTQQIKEGTGRDPVMAKVRHCILMGTGVVYICTADLCCHF